MSYILVDMGALTLRALSDEVSKRPTGIEKSGSLFGFRESPKKYASLVTQRYCCNSFYYVFHELLQIDVDVVGQHHRVLEKHQIFSRERNSRLWNKLSKTFTYEKC